MRFPILFAAVAAAMISACTTTPVEPEQQIEEVVVDQWPQERESLMNRLRENPHLSVQTLNDGALYVQIRSGDSFVTGSAEPSPILTQVLDHVADVLNENGEYEIRVVGHTDNIGSQQTNLKLSGERAMTVQRYLVNKGVSEAYISSEGRGSEEPIASNTTREGRNVNRRIELLIRPLQE